MDVTEDVHQRVAAAVVRNQDEKGAAYARETDRYKSTHACLSHPSVAVHQSNQVRLVTIVL